MFAPPPIDWKKRLQQDMSLPPDYDPEQGPVRDAGMPPPRVARPTNPEIQGDAPVPVDPLQANDPGMRRAQVMGPPAVASPAKPTPPPQGPPPIGKEEQTYNDMLRMGPKRSVWGTVGATAVRALAGYQNGGLKIGQRPVQLDQDRLNGWEQRDPVHGGPWKPGLERQKDLAAGEIDQRKRDEAWQKLQSENEDRAAQAKQREAMAQADLLHGDYWKKSAETAQVAEKDRQRNQAMQRIKDVGGTRGVQILKYPKASPQPVGYDAYLPDPDDPNGMVAVRAHPGLVVDKETAESMGIPPDADGLYHMDAATLRNHKTNQTRGETSANSLEAKKRSDDEHAREFNARMGETEERTRAMRADREDRAAGRSEKRGSEIEANKDNELKGADKWAEAEINKIRGTMGGMVPPADLDRIYAQAAEMKQRAMDAYTQNVRRRGGHASNWKVSVDRNGSYKFDEIPEGPGPAPGPPPVGGHPPAATGGRGAPSSNEAGPYKPGDPVTGPGGRNGKFVGINPKTGKAIVTWD